MKRNQLIFCSLIIGITATAFKLADDIITRLGMQEETARYYFINNLVGRFDNGPMELGSEGGDPNSVYNQLQSFRLPYARTLKNVIEGDKAAAAAEMCDYVKKYVNSEEFIENYNSQREAAMPLTDRGSTLANLRKNKIVFEKNINNYKTDTKYVAEQQKLMEENQKRMDALIEAAKKPFPGKDAWEKAYPADPSGILKKRLQEYLQLAATVDFTAKLTEPDKYKIKKFVNPVYEKKSLKWKAIYRAGKEVNDVVTAFVKEWLKGEIIAKEKTKMAGNPATPSKSENAAATKPAAATSTGNATTTTPAATTGTTATEAEPAATPATKKTGAKKLKDKLKSIIKN
ncbi:MAG: hypothetical protein JNJ86_04035 [Chitinophagaceae bacterium]|nr:hypothetical protein [Chitinophagaceae bacterium]